jgi:hypothetical protein
MVDSISKKQITKAFYSFYMIDEEFSDKIKKHILSISSKKTYFLNHKSKLCKILIIFKYQRLVSSLTKVIENYGWNFQITKSDVNNYLQLFKDNNYTFEEYSDIVCSRPLRWNQPTQILSKKERQMINTRNFRQRAQCKQLSKKRQKEYNDFNSFLYKESTEEEIEFYIQNGDLTRESYEEYYKKMCEAIWDGKYKWIADYEKALFGK